MSGYGGFMNGFLGDSDQAWRLGQRLGLVFNDVKGGKAKGEAMRDANAVADRMNSQMVEVDGPTTWETSDGQSFDNQSDAVRYAQQTGLSIADGRDIRPKTSKQTVRLDQSGKGINAESLYFNKYLPDKVQQLRADGWGTQADQLADYTQSEVGKQYASNYARMLQAHAAGNFDAAAKHLEKLQELNDERHTAQVKPTSDGGYAVTLTDPESGAKKDVTLTQDRLTGDMGLFAYMDPVQMVARLDKARAAKAEALAAVAKERQLTARQLALKGLDFKQDLAKNQQQHGYKLDEITTQAQLDGLKTGETGKKIADLRREFPTLSDDQILSMLKTDGSGYGKAVNPETQAARIHLALMQDPSVIREYGKSYSALSPEQQQAVIARNLSIPRAAANGTIPNNTAGSGTTPPGAATNAPLPMW